MYPDTWRLRFFASEPSSLTSLTWTQEKSLGHMSPRRKPRALPRAHIWSDITHSDPLLNRNCTTLRDANNQYKDPSYQYNNPSRSHPRLRSLLLPRYLQLDSAVPAIHLATLPDHPHVLNIVTPLYQCRLLWIATKISAWWSQQSSGAIWAVTGRS